MKMEDYFNELQKQAARHQDLSASNGHAGQSDDSNKKQPADDPQAADDLPDNPS